MENFQSEASGIEASEKASSDLERSEEREDCEFRAGAFAGFFGGAGEGGEGKCR